ncbi:MAG: metalloregulator ArsR/SmtB family transcription factor [Thermomicrobiales bacterium]
MAGQDQLSVAFSALADPTRRDILVRLRDGPQSVGDLAARYPISRPAVSQHLLVLEKAGLIVRGRRAQWHDCALAPDALDEAATWIAQQRAVWTEQFDLLEEHLKVTRAQCRAAADEGDTTQE